MNFIKSFPSYIQHEQMDCGPACLKIIAEYHGKRYSLSYLRELCYITREGVSLFDIAKASEEIGFRSLAIKASLEDLVEKMPLPLIIHCQQRHFVVVYKTTRKFVYVSDPASGLLRYTHEEFRNSWEGADGLGYLLIVEPTPEFYKLEAIETSSSFQHFMKYLRPHHRYLIQVAIGMIAGILIGLVQPFLSQSIVDVGIGTGDLEFIRIMLIAGVVLATSSMFSGFVQGRLMLYISERVNMGMVSDFLAKILKLPMAFFERRMTTDLMTRIGDHSRIQSFIMSTFLGLFINILLILIYGSLMLYYEVSMFLVFVISTALYTGWIFLFLGRRKKIDNQLFELRATNSNDLLELLEGVQEIKANNISQSRRWKWELSRFRIYGLSVRSMNIDQVEATGASFIMQLQGVFLTYIAASNVVEGTMTLGMMMAAQYILGQLSNPIQSMIGYIHSLQFARLSLRRVNEVILDEKVEPTGNCPMPQDYTLRLKDVSFAYNPHLGNVLNNINLTIPSGQITAIVGESGSGKTTLIKLLMRFYEPTDGSIEIGDQPLFNIDLHQLRMQCGAVLQDGKLFNDTILYNITLQDDPSEIDHKRLAQAVRMANIDSFIKDRPLKLYTPLGSQGSGLSQGQKQRLLIARAIYKDPHILFLDEATNSLDATNEREISNNLEQLMQGRTAVVIAHRLSTVRRAHNIVVLKQGYIVEQGTHEELVLARGTYFNLVSNQLDLN